MPAETPTSRDDRDSGLHQFSAVEAGVRDYVDAVVGGMAVEVVLPSGITVYATQGYESAVNVAANGPGGGFIWQRQWSRRDWRDYLRQVVKYDPQIRRGPAAEVFPADYR